MWKKGKKTTETPIISVDNRPDRIRAEMHNFRRFRFSSIEEMLEWANDWEKVRGPHSEVAHDIMGDDIIQCLPHSQVSFGRCLLSPSVLRLRHGTVHPRISKTSNSKR